MSLAADFRRWCTGERAYWLRVAAVTLVTAVGITAMFVGMGHTSSVMVTLRHAVVHSVVMAALAGAGVPWMRHRLRPFGATVQWAAMLPFVLALAGAGTVIACTVLGWIEGAAAEPFRGCFAMTLPVNAVISMTICTAMTLYESQRRRLDEATLALRTQERDRERDRKMALQARLASLESRLQPHFLFNTLNAISELIQDDPDQAERTVERLAALLRFSLDAAERGLVPLAHELKIVTDYLEIEHTRLSERLAWELAVPGAVADVEVPPLAVQTLVENSVKHAIAPRPGGGRLRVEAALHGDRLVLGVWDDGPGFTAAALRPGHGLESLQARLAARFGTAANLEIGRRDGGALVTLTLPAPVPR